MVFLNPAVRSLRPWNTLPPSSSALSLPRAATLTVLSERDQGKPEAVRPSVHSSSTASTTRDDVTDLGMWQIKTRNITLELGSCSGTMADCSCHVESKQETKPEMHVPAILEEPISESWEQLWNQPGGRKFKQRNKHHLQSTESSSGIFHHKTRKPLSKQNVVLTKTSTD